MYEERPTCSLGFNLTKIGLPAGRNSQVEDRLLAHLDQTGDMVVAARLREHLNVMRA